MFLAAFLLLSISAVFCEIQHPTVVMYRCPPKFFRVGNNCYHLSNEKVPWREAIFKCKDMKGQLAVLDTKLEDRKLRKYLNRHRPDKRERWIAGSYDAQNNVWRWAFKGEPFKYRAFSSQRVRDNAWKCVVMDYYLYYRWNSRSCFQKKKYICEHRLEEIYSDQFPSQSAAKQHNNNNLKRRYKQKPKVESVESNDI